MSHLAEIGKQKHAQLTAEAVLYSQQIDDLIAELLVEVRLQEGQNGRATFGGIYRKLSEIMQQCHKQEVVLLNILLLIEGVKPKRKARVRKV